MKATYRKKRLLACAAAIALTVSMGAESICTAFAADMTQGPGTSGSYSHGSGETVTEDMLKTSDDIPSDYDVNEETQGSAKKGEYTFLFDHDTVQNVYVTIDDNNWNYMLQNAIDKPTVLADSFAITTDSGTYSVSYPSIKTKGNLTLSSVWQSDSDRFSFTVNISKYIKKKNGYSDTQNLFGMTKVALNDIYGDATLMKEYLSYELMRSLGIDTPCYSLVNLYVNDKFYGVYMMVESIDSTLTKRTLGESDDYLVKPESSGGDLVYDSALDAYYDETTGTFDFGTLTDSMPTDASNPLYAYNGLWENDEDTFDDVKDSLPALFKWMKTLNELSNAEDPNTEEYQETLESIVSDVDSLIRYFAANVYLVNLDSYLSNMMQNYALYVNNNSVATVYPWDYNYSFGAYGTGDATTMVNYSISSPLLNATLAERPLLNVILQNDEYKALYEQYLNDCCIIASEGGTTSDGETYAPDNFASILDAYSAQLLTEDGNSYAEDPTAFYTAEQYQQATESFKTLISDRSTAVLRQLSGDTTEVETTVDLQTLGNTTGDNGGDQPGGDQPGGDRPDTMPSGEPGGNGGDPMQTLYYGDVDQDGTVEAEDALTVLKAVVKLAAIEEGMQFDLADMDGDGSLSAEDALEILKTVVQLVDLRTFTPGGDGNNGGGTMPSGAPDGNGGGAMPSGAPDGNGGGTMPSGAPDAMPSAEPADIC